MNRKQLYNDEGQRKYLTPGARDTFRKAAEAGIAGPHATPKSLVRAFGIKGVSSRVPLNMVQKWLGHADLATTAIYADGVGAEAKEIAQRM